MSKKHPVAPRDIRARLDSEQSRKLMDEFGFAKPLLAQVVAERLTESGDDFECFMDFFKAVQAAERDLFAGELNTMQDYYEKQFNAAKPEEKTTVELQLSTNTRSITKNNCIICLENERCMVSIPCRCLHSCQICALKLVNCPKCRQKIEYCLKINV